MIERSQLLTMLTLQASMNAKVNSEWLNAGYPYLRANVVEGGEAMEHHGWKWWKKQEMDKEQFAIELVDIWHFTLSHFLVENKGDLEEAADMILQQGNSAFQRTGKTFDGEFYTFADLDTIRRVELLIGLSVSRRTSIPLFETLMVDAGLDWDATYKLYVGKNVLNFFRQDNGYKQGTYIKQWAGQEDNVWLAEFQRMSPEDTPDELYKRLATAYSEVMKQEA